MIKVISGCQTGVDQAALDAALELDISTGGFCPTNCKRQDGEHPEFIKKYNLIELGSGYKERTWKNVESADLTIRIASDFDSTGERCTLNAIKHFNKPYYDIKLTQYENINKYKQAAIICSGISRILWYMRIENGEECLTVNFAGNSERTSPGIYNKAKQIIKALFCDHNGWRNIYDR